MKFFLMRTSCFLFCFFLGNLLAQETPPLSSPAPSAENATASPASVLAASEPTKEQPSSVSNSSTASSQSTHVPKSDLAKSDLAKSDLAGQASSEKLPQISAAILRAQLQQEEDPLKRRQMALRLGKILLNEENPAEALSLFESKDLAPISDQKNDDLVLFWKAQALMALKRPSEAAPLLESIISSNQLSEKYLTAAQLILARADRMLGDAQKALACLNAIPPDVPLALQERVATLLVLQKNNEIEQLLKETSPQTLAEQPRLAYLFAIAASQEGDNAEALKRFHKINATDAWVSSAVISGIANCDVSLNKPAEAQVLLEKYLQENPQSPRVPDLMRQLEQLYILQNNNDLTLFQQWSNDTTQPLRASYAMLPYARTLQRLGHPSKADQLYTAFLTSYPHHALANEASLELAESKLLQGDAAAALSYVADRPDLPPALRARYAFERGLAEAALKHPDLAEKAFGEAAAVDPRLSPDALYNQSLVKIISSDQDKNSSSAVSKNNSDEQTREHNDYLAVLATDQGTRQSAPAVIQAARHFLEKYPQSSFENEVRMKLGEALLIYGNVREARIELETVAKLEPSSELGRQALFLAAQAASRSMDSKSMDDALMLLEQIAQSPNAGADVWQARLEQASLKNAQALPLEAIAIYDQILSSTEPSPQLRQIAQMAKGDTLNALGPKDRANYQAAIATWRQLADASDTPSCWRNQALCKIGLTDEKIGDTDAALAAYYEAMKTPLNKEPDLLWHDKAAFEAARLLENRKQWSDAIRLYQQIVAEGGARAREAQDRVSKLRLENFLWEK